MRTFIITILLLLSIYLPAQNQNLIYNSSFEEFAECPKKIDALGILTIVDAWYQPTLGSADFFHPCGARDCSVPKNKLGIQYPRTGNGMCGIYCSKTDYREYLQTELKQTLKAGERYRLTFYVSLSEYSTGAVATIGGLLTSRRLTDTTRGILRVKETERMGNRITQTMISVVEPQVVNPYSNILQDTENWTKIEGEFTAEGGERFLTVGNFYTIEQSNHIMPEHVTNLLPGAYYYLDDVELICITCVNQIVIDSISGDTIDVVDYGPPFNIAKVGTSYVLENIFFDFDKSTLLQQSYVELQKLYSFLNDNPKMRVEISGHTDAKGSVDYNQKLSEERAKSVVGYLIKRGISSDRLKYKGYGKARPIATNETAEGREKNRRVEFTILSM